MTELPTALLTTYPTLAGSPAFASASQCSTTVDVPARRPRRTVALNSALERIRPSAATDYAARRPRPLRRRDDKIDRPARVRMR
jgi:hypothetical protein